NNSNNATNTLTITPTAAVPVDSTLFVVGAEATATDGTWSASDNKSNTYVADFSQSVNVETGILRATVTTALTTSDTITVTFPVAGSFRRAVSAYFVKGLITRSPVDKTGVINGTATPWTVSPLVATMPANACESSVYLL